MLVCVGFMASPRPSPHENVMSKTRSFCPCRDIPKDILSGNFAEIMVNKSPVLHPGHPPINMTANYCPALC